MGASKNKDILKKVLDFAMSVSYNIVTIKILEYYMTILFCRTKFVHKILYLL